MSELEMDLRPAVLLELESRAGASDTDREAWLEERRGGLTATQVRDLAIGRLTIPQLVAMKMGWIPDEGDLSHIPVIAWGNEREPVIAAKLRQRFSFEPESRVFRAADDPRLLASPDGVRVSFDEDLEIAEIKTAGKDVAPWTDAYQEKGYEYQCQWGMRVTGARRCLYVWEIRVPVDSSRRTFAPGPLKWSWIDRDEKVIHKLERIADEFLAALEEAQSKGAPAAVEYDEIVDTHAVNYLRAMQAKADAEQLRASSYAALLEAGVSQTSEMARVTFTPAKAATSGTVSEIDYAAAEAADPELFARMRAAADAWAAHCERFAREVEVAGKASPAKVTITAVKAEMKGENDER